MLTGCEIGHFLKEFIKFGGYGVLSGGKVELIGGEFGDDLLNTVHIGLGARGVHKYGSPANQNCLKPMRSVWVGSFMYLGQNQTEPNQSKPFMYRLAHGFRFIDSIKTELNRSKPIIFFIVVWFDFKYC